MAQLKYPVGYQRCYRCKTIKSIAHFYSNTSYICKDCKRLHVKSWNAANKEQHLSNKLKGIRRNQDYLYSYLQNKTCRHCSTSDLLVLELHHLHGKQKRTHNVSTLVNGGATLSRVKNELEKCVVLCRNCHIIEECRIRYEKGVSDFRYAFQYHNELPSYPRTQQIAKKNYLISYFQTHPCEDCSLNNVVPLQFDHTSTNKEYTIGWLLNNRGLDLMKAEILKCSVVCANCHNHRTIVRSESYRSKYLKERELNI